MPYISSSCRIEVDKKLTEFLSFLGALDSGEFVYILYQLMLWQGSFGGGKDLPANFELGSRVLADVESAKLEYYRRILAPYEDKKIKENGDVIPIKVRIK